MDVAKIDNDVLTSDDVIKWLKLSRTFDEVTQDLLNVKLAAAAARRQGVKPSPDEVQAKVDHYRRVEGLHRAKDAKAFLDASGVTLDEFEGYITDLLFVDKMYAQLTSQDAVEKYFKLNSPDFDGVEISYIAVDTEGKAKELMSILKDDPERFVDLAKEHSIDENAAEGGRVGKVLRGSLESDLEAKVFNASEGDLVGPVAAATGVYQVFKIDAKLPATLDDSETADAVRHRIYREWLETRREEHKFEIL